MDGHLGAATMQLPPWQTQKSISIDDSPTDYVSQHKYTYYRRPTSSSHLFWMHNFFSLRSYNFIFCMPSDWLDDDGWTHTRWYTIKIHSDGSGKVYSKENPLASFWEGELSVFDGFAYIGSHIYRFDGPSCRICPSDVYKLHVNPRFASGWVPLCKMISTRVDARSLVLDGKIYVFSRGRESYIEVFDPDDGKWDGLPDPPYDSSCTVLFAALENPNRILVAFCVSGKPGSAMFYTYNVQHRSWEMLAPAERELHPEYPVGFNRRAVTVHNTLYWVIRAYRREEITLLAYDLDLDMWLEGRLKGLGILLFEDDKSCFTLPFLFHLEKQRFCLLQTYGDLHCVAVDIYHMPGENRLGISLAWERKHKIDGPGEISDCLLLPEIEQGELPGAN
ncbi:uncharacterized protein LOC133860119 isoform X2 [Alnus glutinosa]|uniref:uncharacterized protein LOC133860119 isoform X2 n=1 Tax=Alnus glutinosa TaxID=3517 RepID=UPI002D792F66|nr:uncharacterized protein LOC133860119 isoform X2 [Alnus glutinosa]